MRIKLFLGLLPIVCLLGTVIAAPVSGFSGNTFSTNDGFAVAAGDNFDGNVVAGDFSVAPGSSSGYTLSSGFDSGGFNSDGSIAGIVVQLVETVPVQVLGDAVVGPGAF